MTPQVVQQIVKGFLRKFKILLSTEDLNDLCQDVHVELLKLRQRYDKDKGDWRSYAFCRIKGAVLDYRKKQSSNKLQPLLREVAITNERQDGFWVCIAESTGSYLLEDRFRGRMKIRELAKKYGVHKSTIILWLKDHLKVLKTELRP